MYIQEAIPALLQSLAALSNCRTEILIAHGRNRFAEGIFRDLCTGTRDAGPAGSALAGEHGMAPSSEPALAGTVTSKHGFNSSRPFFSIASVSDGELDDVYRCDDVSLLRLRKRP